MAELVQILVVEDNAADQMLFREGVAGCDRPVQLNFVSDGVEALAYLRAEGKYSSQPKPHLILLDLNIPKKDGREVLAEVKTDPLLRDIPVVVLSTSSSPEDTSTAYKLGANNYLVKPNDLYQFLKVVEDVVAYAFTLVK